jgi:hexosaminidase
VVAAFSSPTHVLSFLSPFCLKMVRSTSLRSLAGLALVAIFFAPAAHCLWPQPSSLTSGDKARSLSPNFAISIPKSLNKDKDMIDACQRALDRIYDLALKPYIPDRGQSLADQVKKSSPLTKLNVEINEQAGFDIHWNKNKIFESVKEFNDDEQIRLLKRGGKDDQSISALTMQPLEKLDESYELSVPDGDGVATLKAKNALGALRGLATFSQLVYDLPDESTQFIKDLPMSIKDKPAFPYRGLCEYSPKRLMIGC